MSKKQDLFNVFNFIAEYLREEETIDSNKQLLVESKFLNRRGNIDDVLSKLQNPIENLTSGAGAKHIKDLMDRIDSKDIQTATTSQLLNAQRKSFENEVKKIKEEYVEKLTAEKNTDEIVVSSGETETQKSGDKLLNE
jgi:hypothetical protein